MANLAIQGHATRGKEVIEILEMLGGRNASACTGANINTAYVLARYGPINIIDYINLKSQEYNLHLFTLDEFLEKFPYKVGDKVKTSLHFANCIGTVKRMRWEQNENVIIYDVEWSDANKSTLTYYAQGLQLYKEETMDKANKAVFDANAQCCDIMNHIIKEETMEEQIVTEDITLEKAVMCTFCEMVEGKQRLRIAMNEGFELKEENGNFFVYKKKGKYPKTYEECCKILGYSGNYNIILTTDVDNKLFNALYRLKVCRDAYWKIAGEQMGLGKPWEPEYIEGVVNTYYTIHLFNSKLFLGGTSHRSAILCFPIEEMRNAFYENFKVLIEQCKELL